MNPPKLNLCDVVIRWNAKDHPTRPGEIFLLPWCEEFDKTRLFQRGGPGGFYAYRRHIEKTKARNRTPLTPSHWLQSVLTELITYWGLDAGAVKLAFDDLENFSRERLYDDIHWTPQQKGGK